MDMLFILSVLLLMHLYSQFSFPRPALANFATSPHPHHRACSRLYSCFHLPASLLTKGYLMPSYIQVILHASTRGRNLLPHESLAKSHQETGKVNKEYLHYHKPWYLGSIGQKLPVPFAINHSSDSSERDWVGGKGSAVGKKVLILERGSAALFLPPSYPLRAAQNCQGAKNLGQVSLHFPVSVWFQLSLLACPQWVFILPVLTYPHVLAWALLPQDI